MKLAILSNINVDYISRQLSSYFSLVPAIGYGDEWGQLLNTKSELNTHNPDVIIFLPDIEQLLNDYVSDWKKDIDQWFSMFDNILQKDKDYFISSVFFRSYLITGNDEMLEQTICHYWNERIEERIEKHVNVHYLHIAEAVYSKGKEICLSEKLWYLGKIPYSNEGSRLIVDTIRNAVSVLTRAPKKVLILDLDNTLWGGILGEVGVDGINLSDDHIGAVYKKVQKQIKAIKDTGVLLAIVSKNNATDVQEVWDRHPHMFLSKEDFVVRKINWQDKADNIQDISKELNLGIDSFVFIDDMPTERENIKKRLPSVTVPDFPTQIENYPTFISKLYEKYFKKIRILSEDRNKTQQYFENTQRLEASKGLSFEDFLISLNIRASRLILDDAKLERIAQMHNKTNQFNLTTIRYTRQDIDRLIQSGYKIYTYDVHDKFGDYGLVVVVIIQPQQNVAEINSFLMSCRVMGKLIENYVIDDVEKDLLKAGYSILRAKYTKTAKNTPVEHLFDGLGYSPISKTTDETIYEIELKNCPKRQFFVNL